jgi:alkylation response protein AidB-like acyl-CoA dehydrogenase
VDFNLNEHQSVWKVKASRFADEELRPSWRELELNRGALTAVSKKADASGLFDICLTGEKDKESSDILTMALVTEELSKGHCGFAAMFVNRYLSSRAAQISPSHDFRNEALERITNSPDGDEIAFLSPRIAAGDSAPEDTTGETVRLKEADMPYDKLIDNLLAERMILFSAMALGVAGAAFEYAVAYSGARIAFGRPIIQHQAIGLKLADMYIDLTAARLLLWETSRKQAEGEGQARQMRAALDYWHKVALDIASNTMRVLGGHGYLGDHPAERWVREIQFLRLLR